MGTTRTALWLTADEMDQAADEIWALADRVWAPGTRTLLRQSASSLRWQARWERRERSGDA
jgi:hypothetical protein